MQHAWARFYAITIITLCALLTPRPAWAVRTDMNINTLKGIGGVFVIVQTFDDNIVKDGLSHDGVQKAVEARLHAAGIKTMSEDELGKGNGAILFLALDSIKSDGGVYACNINMELIQVASLTRDPEVLIPATTWTTGMVVMVSSTQVDHLRDMTMEVVDQFTKDFHTANTSESAKLKSA